MSEKRTKVCKNCYKEFETKDFRKDYCSKNCKRESVNRNVNKRQRQQKILEKAREEELIEAILENPRQALEEVEPATEPLRTKRGCFLRGIKTDKEGRRGFDSYKKRCKRCQNLFDTDTNNAKVCPNCAYQGSYKIITCKKCDNTYKKESIEKEREGGITNYICPECEEILIPKNPSKRWQ